jgi:hypothetical protein
MVFSGIGLAPFPHARLALLELIGLVGAILDDSNSRAFIREERLKIADPNLAEDRFRSRIMAGNHYIVCSLAFRGENQFSGAVPRDCRLDGIQNGFTKPAATERNRRRWVEYPLPVPAYPGAVFHHLRTREGRHFFYQSIHIYGRDARQVPS